ncbi:MAG: acetamidase [SAR202 cluster bacterium]|nr:acetamidase [SAR202 cluster bacterium]
MRAIVPDANQKNWVCVLGPYAKPIATVKPGETVVMETMDAFGNRIHSEDQDLVKILRMPYVNPITGPIYVEGAEPGDTLTVKIEQIEIIRDFSISSIIPDFGGVCGTSWTRVLNDPLKPRIFRHEIKDKLITWGQGLKIPKIPIEPFYGTIGTSPALEAISTLSPGFHGGNMDDPDVCPGNTVHLPVNEPGALFGVGDGHAVQGDAEVSGAAIEVPTRGVFTFGIIKKQAIRTPRIVNDEFLMTVGSARPMEDAARIAFYELIMWLEAEYGIEKMAGYQLCSHVAKVRLANMVDTLYSVSAKFPRYYLPKKR